MKKKMKINWGVEFNTNNYERIIEVEIVEDTDEDQNGEFPITTIIPCNGWIGGDVYTYEGDPKTGHNCGVDAIDNWFYDNISELTSCEDEFIKDTDNVHCSDYVRYILL